MAKFKDWHYAEAEVVTKEIYRSVYNNFYSKRDIIATALAAAEKRGEERANGGVFVHRVADLLQETGASINRDILQDCMQRAAIRSRKSS